MENCLVTKLKGVADNNSLKKIGEFTCRLKLNGYNIQRTAFTSSTEEVEVTLLNDGVTFDTATGRHRIIDSKHAIMCTAYVQGAVLSVAGVTSDSWIDVKIRSKYDITAVNVSVDYINIDDFAYCEGITSFNPVANGNDYGDLKSIKKWIDCTYFNVQGSLGISGDMTDMGGLILLTSIGIANIPLTGSWDSFVASQRLNGRTTCDGIDIRATYSCLIPFGIKPKTNVGDAGEIAVLKWTSDKMSLQWDTSKLVWTVGYTAQEIATMTGTGGVWEGYAATMCD